jgi:CRP-like cAMP-binding protein
MPNSSNLLLASLSANDAAALQPHLKSVYLEHEKILFEAGGEVTAIYFPTGAIVSLVVGLSSGELVEAAMVGKDGLVGASTAIGGNIPSNRGIVQLAGTAMTCDVDALKSAALRSHTLLSALVRHEQTVYAQASQSAACMAAHNVEARLCRWLLRARDLAGTDTLAFTQEFLAEMLGVRRTSVTLHARILQQAGLIKYSRGKIQIIDVEAVKETACECYGTVKSYYQALLGHGPASGPI